MIDLITIGHATIDAFLAIDEASLACDLNREDCVLQIEYADKIPVLSLNWAVGGNAPNTAVGVARLGLKVAALTMLGGDDNGRLVLKTLKDEGVITNHITILKDQKTDYSTILNFQGERTILAYHSPWVYQFPADLPFAKSVYLTSLNEKFADYYEDFLPWLGKHHPDLIYNPGLHELRGRISQIEPVLAQTDLLIVNEDEAERILKLVGQDYDRDQPRLGLQALADLGPKRVVLTSGERGSAAFDGENFYLMGVFPAQRVEMTGAGDAFSAGLIAALIRGETLPEALRWGAANSAAVIGQIGSQAGLLTAEKLSQTLADHPEIKP